MIVEEDDEEYVRELVLEMLSKGCDKTNFLILLQLPTKTSELRRKLGLSKMPFYRRIKQLSDTGLLEHRKGSSELRETDLTSRFIRLVNALNNEVVRQAKIELRET